MKTRKLLSLLLTALMLLSLIPAGTLTAYAATLIVTSSADSGPGSLRNALSSAGVGDTVTFAASVTVITLNSALEVTKDVTIDGGGNVTLLLNTTGYRHIIVTDGELTLKGLTLTGLGGAGANNGGIESAGFVTAERCWINSCRADRGGGIRAGVINLYGCTISGNTTVSSSAALYATNTVDDAINTSILTNCTVAGNIGSGIYSSYAVFLHNCTVSGNIGVGVFAQFHARLYGTVLAGNYNGDGSRTYELQDIYGVGEIENAEFLDEEVSYGKHSIIGFSLDAPSDLMETEIIKINGIDCEIGKLADNGGGMPTILPKAGLLNRIPASETWLPASDQRGVDRPSGSMADVGAVEISKDASLLTVAGQAITAGVEAGTDAEPKTAGISVANGVSSVANANLTASTYAMAELYSDNTFTTPQSPVSLSVGENHLFIKVTAEDSVTELYYDVTVTRASGGGYTPPAQTPSEKAIDDINKAKDGDTVKMTLGSDTTLKKEVLEALAGKDITIEITVGSITWIIYGKDVPPTGLKDLDLGVSVNVNTIPVEVINLITGEKSVIQISLKHDGPFGFPMTLKINLGSSNAGYWANLYYYNKEAGEPEFKNAARIASDGETLLLFGGASDYAIAIDDHDHGAGIPFEDVKETDWFVDGVMYAYGKGLMTGTSTEGGVLFSPNTAITRGMVVTVLYRMQVAVPSIFYENPFDDVDEGVWYADAVKWAYHNNIVSGYGNGKFGPNDNITREQMATILLNYELFSDKIPLDILMDREFADWNAISDWAKNAVNKLTMQGVINGKPDNLFDPKGSATRAEFAVLLMRFLESL